ncbi:hypothetical protein TNCV_4272571 [Trichonephila clavipes]|nr:hypothetical protein TNCV_4272571 [Trichonephila clavipes]
MQVTVRFCSVPPQFSGGDQGPSTSLPLPPTNFTRGLAARRLFRVTPCREGTIHLQNSMSSPGFEHRPYDTVISVASHCTGRPT